MGPLGYAAGFSSLDCGMSKLGSSSSSSISNGTSDSPLVLVTSGRNAGNFIPPAGATLGEHNGSDGDDWKWRSVGLLSDGVEGMTSLVGLLSLIPGVAIVKLKFEGRLRGGVGGLMKRGDGGAELFFSLLTSAGGAAGA